MIKQNKNKIAKAINLKPAEFELLDLGGMPFIRSKYYTGLATGIGQQGAEFLTERIVAVIQNTKERLNTLKKAKRYPSWVFAHERPFRLDAFMECRHLMNKQTAGQLCAAVWIDAENPCINIEAWRLLFSFYGKRLMTKEDLKVWNSLPAKFTVWHGDEGDEDEFLSWTLDKKVAEFFAQRFVNNPRAVISKQVKKADCLCYFGGRNEQEIIIL